MISKWCGLYGNSIIVWKKILYYQGMCVSEGNSLPTNSVDSLLHEML